jgi:membrane protein
LAYSWLFAIFPFVVFLLSLVPLLPEKVKPNIEVEIRESLSGRISDQSVNSAVEYVKALMEREDTKTLLSFGLLIAIWAASAGMARTMYALDRAYDIDKTRRFYWRRVVAIALTIVVATLVVTVLILMPVGTGVLNWLIKQQSILPSLYIVANIARYFLAMLLMFTVLAVIYHFGPSVRHKFVAVTPGALFCVIVWLLLGWGFKMYLVEFRGAENYQKTYGAVAGAAILLLLFYVDALVLLIGAEINSEIDNALK